MQLPTTKHSALISHICRMMGKDPLSYGETAGKIIKVLPDNEVEYRYIYALIINKKRDELRNYLKDYEPIITPK